MLQGKSRTETKKEGKRGYGDVIRNYARRGCVPIWDLSPNREAHPSLSLSDSVWTPASTVLYSFALSDLSSTSDLSIVASLSDFFRSSRIGTCSSSSSHLYLLVESCTSVAFPISNALLFRGRELRGSFLGWLFPALLICMSGFSFEKSLSSKLILSILRIRFFVSSS